MHPSICTGCLPWTQSCIHYSTAHTSIQTYIHHEHIHTFILVPFPFPFMYVFRVETREAISSWFCEQHNIVNKRKNKSMFSCDLVCMYLCFYVCMHLWIYGWMCRYVSLYVFYVYLHICMCAMQACINVLSLKYKCECVWINVYTHTQAALDTRWLNGVPKCWNETPDWEKPEE